MIDFYVIWKISFFENSFFKIPKLYLTFHLLLAFHACSFFFKFIYFLAALGLHRCMRAFSSCGEWELHFVVVCRLLLIAVASLAAEHRL